MSSKVRRFIGGWWHADDVQAAAESLALDLAGLELAGVPVALLETACRPEIDEGDARRHQIGIAARHANEQLAQLGRPERVRAFREGVEWSQMNDDETDEPLWFIVDPEEHARLLAEIGAPEGLEHEYDAPAGHPDPLIRVP